MLVIVDMLLAVAVLSFALRAVPEIHVRMALIGNAADRAAVKGPLVMASEALGLSGHLSPAVLHHPDKVPGKKEEEVAD